MSLTSPPVTASGGDTVQDIGGYRIHTFTTVGTSSFVVTRGGPVEVLVVAGGGSGGMRHAGGGGAGGLIYNSSFPVTGTVSVTVGDGGASVPTGSGNNGPGNSGSNSVFGSLTAIGGGYGNQGNGGSGGSGGGVFYSNPVGAGTAGQGNNGAFGSTGPFSVENTYAGGGGGGAGAAGTASTSVAPVQAGAGGIGLQYSISGTPVYYAGGGGGGTALSGGGGGAGGLGGGGAGGGPNSTVGIAGTNGTGGGGGAGGFQGGTNYASGKGGSGIVIVRYPLGTLAAGPQPKIFLGPLLSYPTSTGTAPTSDGTKLTFARASGQSLNFGPQTIDMAKGFSVTCRFAFTGTVGGYERIIEFTSGPSKNTLLLCRSTSAGGTAAGITGGYRLTDGTQYLLVYDSPVFEQNIVNDVALVYNPPAFSLYVNGSLATSRSDGTNASDVRILSNCFVGQGDSASYMFNGDIYSLNVYNRLLTPSELVGPAAPSPWSTISYNYPLDSVSSVVGAYSMRRLLSSYNGPMIRLRRQSDLALMDFAGDNFGNLSNAQTAQTVSAWIGASSANVMIWYDQSSGANHAPYTVDTAYGLPPPFTLTDGIYFPNQNFVNSTTYYYGLKLGVAKTIQACLCNFKLKSGKTNDQNWNSLVAASYDNAGVRLAGNPGSLIIGDGNDLLTTGCYTLFDGAYSSRTSNGPFFTNTNDVYHKMFANRTVGQYGYQMLYIGTANPTNIDLLKARSTYGYMNELVFFNGSIDPQNALRYLVSS